MVIAFGFAYGALILIALINFPLIPAFFGVYGNARHTFHGTLILGLLLAFPIIAILSVYLVASIGAMWGFIPIVYLTGLWGIRPNRFRGHRGRQFPTLYKNLSALEEQIRWKQGDWEQNLGKNVHLMLIGYIPGAESVDKIAQSLKRDNEFVELKGPDQEGEVTLVFQFLYRDLEPVRKNLDNLVQLVWPFGGEIRTIEIEGLA